MCNCASEVPILQRAPRCSVLVHARVHPSMTFECVIYAMPLIARAPRLYDSGGVDDVETSGKGSLHVALATVVVRSYE